MRSGALVLAILAAACGGRPERYPREFHDCVDRPRGFRDGEPQTPSLAGHAASDLFEDERALATAPICAPPPGLLDDTALRTACDASTRTVPRPASCRAACIAAGRERIGVRLYDTIVTELRLLPARMAERERTTCRDVLKTGNTATGEGARNVWRCLGLAELPSSAHVKLVFHPVVLVDDGRTLSVGQGELEQVFVAAQLVPDGPMHHLELSRAGRGCTMRGWHVWSRVARRHPVFWLDDPVAK